MTKLTIDMNAVKRLEAHEREKLRHTLVELDQALERERKTPRERVIELRLTNRERQMALRHLRQPGGAFSYDEMKDGSFEAFGSMLIKLQEALVEEDRRG